MEKLSRDAGEVDGLAFLRTDHVNATMAGVGADARSTENDRLRRISRLVPGCHAGNVLRNVLLADVIGGSMGAATSTVATGRRGPSWRDRVHVL